MAEINLVCINHKLLNSLFPPKEYKKMYLLDNMLSYGKPFILDWAIPQEEGVPGSQVTRLQLWHDRVVMSRHGKARLIKSKYKPV